MAEIEGQGWKEDQTVSSSERNIRGVLKIVELLRNRGGHDSSDNIGPIYGDGGMNRWFLKLDGEVLFSKRHCYDQRVLKKVADLGFRLIV